MWTNWHAARIVERLETSQIDWTDYSGLLNQTRDIISVAPLRSTSTSTGAMTRQEANSLVFRDFGFTAVNVQAVELRLSVDRLARIQDRTIQLYYQGAQGRNLANPLSENQQVYGGDLWGLTEPLIWTSADFGVIIDLQPHQTYPSSNPVVIRSVELRLNFS
jgi:hypothetical protein